jgi:hypothetical protein
MALCRSIRELLAVMDHCDQSIPVASDVENHVPINCIRVRKRGPNLSEILPPGLRDDQSPGSYLIPRIVKFRGSLREMLPGDDNHIINPTLHFVMV